MATAPSGFDDLVSRHAAGDEIAPPGAAPAAKRGMNWVGASHHYATELHIEAKLRRKQMFSHGGAAMGQE
jgi:hypothetical protein